MGGTPKAKAQAKTQLNIAALAARNLGGFVPNKIFVGGVPITVTEEQFRTYFESFGAISRVELHALRGFGYVTYESVEAVDACLEKYDEHYFNKKWVEVKRSIPRELIDSYEREQKRLLAEQEALANGGTSRASASATDNPGKVEGSADRPAPTPGPSAPQSSGAADRSPGGPGVSPTASAWASPSGLPAPAKAGGPWSRGQPGSTPTPSAHDAPGAAGWGASRGQPAVKKEPSNTVVLGKVAQLKEMGFSEEVAKRVLQECVWDVNQAIDRLLSSGVMPGEQPGDSAGGDAAPPAEGKATAAAPAAPPPPDSSEAFPGLTPVSRPGVTSWPAPGPASPAPAPSGDAPTAPPQQTEAGRGAATEEQEEEEDPSSAAAVPEVVPATVQEPTLVHVEPEVSPVGASEPARQTGGPAVAPVAAAPEPTTAQARPVPKRLERVKDAWSGEDPSQLAVSEGQFVSVWLDTHTEHGWIHAEAQSFGGAGTAAGWLPVCILQSLPEGRRWMRATQSWEPMDSSQSGVKEGDCVMVWVASRTDEGWAYVEAAEDDPSPSRPGWLPVFCLEWNVE